MTKIKYLYILLAIISLIPLISATDFGYNSNRGLTTGGIVNNNITNVQEINGTYYNITNINITEVTNFSNVAFTNQSTDWGNNNITANWFFGFLNYSWLQSVPPFLTSESADLLYANIIWGYNQTTPAVIISNAYCDANLSNYYTKTQTDNNYSAIVWGYNMTIPFTNWLSTFVYDYNQTTIYTHLSNFTDDLGNRGYTSLSNFSDDIGATSTYNATYNMWAYNQTIIGDGSYNATYELWAYNQTTPFTTWLSGFLYDYNQTIVYTSLSNFTDDIGATSTYNATYAEWTYNMTTPAMTYEYNQTTATYNLYDNRWYTPNDGITLDINNITNFLYNYNQTINFGSYNSTYDAKVSYAFGDCPNGKVVQNTTISGVQCIAVSSAGVYNATYESTSLDVTANRSAWFLTYNSTYDLWSYNQTTPFTSWLATFVYNYNQTIPAITYTNAMVGTKDLHTHDAANITNIAYLNNKTTSDWTNITGKPTACSAGTYATALPTTSGTALTCSIVPTYNSTYDAKVNRAGDTMTGALIFENNNITTVGTLTFNGATTNKIYDNVSCIIIEGSTSRLYVC
jgi:hypothetical protein